MLDIKEMSLAYREAKILDDVSFTVEPGEICALVAPNGSGKTTLMKAVGAHIWPDHGRCLADEIDSARKTAAYTSKVLYVPDGGKLLHDDLSVFEHLQATKCLWRSDADLNAVSKQCLTDEMLSKRGKELSQGMKQQASLAIVCMSKARYILFDEPTNGFDQTNSRMFWKVVSQLAQHDTGIVISSHILNELDEMCDTVYFLKDGRLIRPHNQGYQGSCSEIYAQLYEGDEP